MTGNVTAGSRKAADDWAKDKRQFLQGYLGTCPVRCSNVYPPLNVKALSASCWEGFHPHQINLFGIVTSASIFFFAHLAFCAAAILALDAALTTRFFFATLMGAGDFIFDHLAFAGAAIFARAAAERFPLPPSFFTVTGVTGAVLGGRPLRFPPLLTADPPPPMISVTFVLRASICLRMWRAFSRVSMG